MGQANMPPAENSQSAAVTAITDPPPEGFWQSFTVFRWSFERSLTQQWYLVGLTCVVLVLGTAFLRDLAVGKEFSQDMGIYFQDGNFRYSSLYYVLVTRWVYTAFFIGLLLTVGLVSRWQRSIPQVFQLLERRYQPSVPQPGMENDFQRSLAAYQRALLHGKGGILTRAAITGLVALGTLIVLSISFARDDWLTLVELASTASPVVVLIQVVWDVVVDAVIPLLFIFLLASFLWMVGTTGFFLRRLIVRFSLHHQFAPIANDDGSTFLGYFVLMLALIVLALAVLLVGYWFWHGFSVGPVGASLLLLILILFLARTYFGPVYALRQSLLKERRALAGK